MGQQKNLTPVTLELGGKSPCVVDSNINIEYTANGTWANLSMPVLYRSWLSFSQQQDQQALLDSIQKYIREFYGTEPSASPDYARIINQNIFPSGWFSQRR